MGARSTGSPDFTTVNFGAIALPIAQRYAQVALDRIKAQWPVSSGRSRDGWRVDVKGAGEEWSIVLTNVEEYARYVVAKGEKLPMAQALGDMIIAEISVAMDYEIEVAIADALSRAKTSSAGGV